jgi:hypothetical protein
MAELSAQAPLPRAKGSGRAGRVGRAGKGSRNGPKREGQQATEAGLDLLRVLGWLVMHDVTVPGAGEPDGEERSIDHVLAGPSGVYVVNTVSWPGAIDAKEHALVVGGVDRADAIAEVCAAADAVRGVLHGIPVAPMLCFERLESVTGVAAAVALCASENILDLLTSQPPIVDQAAVAKASGMLGLACRPSSRTPGVTTPPPPRAGEPARNGAPNGHAHPETSGVPLGGSSDVTAAAEPPVEAAAKPALKVVASAEDIARVAAFERLMDGTGGTTPEHLAPDAVVEAPVEAAVEATLEVAAVTQATLADPEPVDVEAAVLEAELWEREVAEADHREREATEEQERALLEATTRAAEEDRERETADREAKEARDRKAREALERVEREALRLAEDEARELAEREVQERERAEAEARIRLEQETREAAEREARELAEWEALERAVREELERERVEAQERAEQEAREAAEREARELAEWEARERAVREALEQDRVAAQERERVRIEEQERAEREARELAEAQQRAEAAERVRVEQEPREAAEREARERAEAQERDRVRIEEQERAEQEAREAAEREARELAEAQERAEAAERVRLEQEAREAAEREARERAEAQERDRVRIEEQERAEQEAREAAEREARELAEAQERDRVRIEEQERAEQEAREAAEREARERAEAQERAEAAERDAHEREWAEAEARLRVEQEARERAARADVLPDPEPDELTTADEDEVQARADRVAAIREREAQRARERAEEEAATQAAAARRRAAAEAPERREPSRAEVRRTRTPVATPAATGTRTAEAADDPEPRPGRTRAYVLLTIGAVLIVGVAFGAPRLPDAVSAVRGLFVDSTTHVGTAVTVKATATHPDVTVLAGSPVNAHATGGFRAAKGQHLVAVPLRLSNAGLLRWDLAIGASATAVDDQGSTVTTAKDVPGLKGGLTLLPGQEKIAPGEAVTGYVVFPVTDGHTLESVSIGLAGPTGDVVTWQVAP